MKKLTALILALLLLAGCAAPAIYNGPTETVWVMTQMNTTGYGEYDGSSSYQQVETYSYDVCGNRIGACLYNEDKLTRKVTWAYDERGNCTKETTQMGFLSRNRIEFTYDEHNRLQTTTYRDILGIKTGVETYTYDEAGTTVTWDGMYDIQTKTLNENGDPIRVVSTGKDSGVVTETVYEYDELGRNTGIVEYRDGGLSSTTVICYDDQGRILEQITASGDGEIYSSYTSQYTEQTVTILDADGYKTIEYLRPDGQVEKVEHYNRSGELERVTEYIYTQIQIPAKEE